MFWPFSSKTPLITPEDFHWMQHALRLAKQAAMRGEVPIGAVLINNETVIGEGANACITSCDPSAHAEIVALRQAAKHLGNYRLPGTTLYVTLEPCAMCAGAIVHSRIDRVVFGANDEKRGAFGSLINIPAALTQDHHLHIISGVLSMQSAEILKNFFRARRRRKQRSRELLNWITKKF